MIKAVAASAVITVAVSLGSVPIAAVQTAAPSPHALVAASIELASSTTVLVRPTEAPAVLYGGGIQYLLQGLPCKVSDCTETLKHPLLYPGNATSGADIGAAKLAAILNDTSSETPSDSSDRIVVGYSLGAIVVDKYLQAHPLGNGKTLFIQIGDPFNTLSGSTPVPIVTDAQILYVINEGDLFAAQPKKPGFGWYSNVVGRLLTHASYKNVDLFSPTNVVFDKGGATYVLVPLGDEASGAKFMRAIGLGSVYDKINDRKVARIRAMYGPGDAFGPNGPIMPEGATPVSLADKYPQLVPTTQSAPKVVARVNDDESKSAKVMTSFQKSPSVTSESSEESANTDNSTQDVNTAPKTAEVQDKSVVAPTKIRHSLNHKDGEKKRVGLFHRKARADSTSRTSKKPADSSDGK